jgi:hypothetical protein
MIAEIPDFDRAVREALAEVNYDMIPVLAKLSPGQRFAMIGDLADHACETYITQELQANPALLLEEVQLRAAERMLIDGGVDPQIVQRVCRSEVCR